MKREDLDKRICDVEKEATNTETYREFIKGGSKELYGCDVVSDEKLDNASDEELTDMIEELNWLLWK